MTVVTKSIEVDSRGENDVVDITQEVQRCLAESRLGSGVVTVFVAGSTAAVTTLEFEPGLAKDFPDALERAAPKDRAYEHEKTWHDGKGHSHVKSALVGTSLAVPFVGGRLALGTWQQIVLAEFDVRPRTRKVVLQIMGE